MFAPFFSHSPAARFDALLCCVSYYRRRPSISQTSLRHLLCWLALLSASSCMRVTQCTGVTIPHRRIFPIAACLIRCSHTTEELEAASCSPCRDRAIKPSHQYVFIHRCQHCNLGPYPSVITELEQDHDGCGRDVTALRRPRDEHSAHAHAHVLLFFYFSSLPLDSRLKSGLCSAAPQSGIILRWIKKTFHHHNPAD